MQIQRQQTSKRMSQMVTYQGTVYLSGQVAESGQGNIEQQTRETLEEIEKLLLEAGSDLKSILSVTIYLQDIKRDFSGMNAVWDNWLPEGYAPARATVEALLCDESYLVEMSVVAALLDQ